MVKKIITLLTVIILITSNSFAVKIEAVVNKEVITDTDITKRGNMLRYINPTARDKGTSALNKMSLTELIIMSVKNQIATKNGVAVSDEDVKETKTRMFNGQKITLPFDEKEFDKNLKSQIMWARFVNGRYGPKVNITDAEVDEYMNQAQNTGTLPTGDKINLSQIQLIEKEKADKVYELTKSIKSCAEFDKVAPDYGEAGSGAVGDVSLSQMDKAVADFLRSSPSLTTLSPFKTASGYTIFFVCSKKKIGTKEKAQLKEQSKNSIVQQKAEIMGEKLLKDSFAEFYIDVKSEKYKDILNELR